MGSFDRELESKNLLIAPAGKLNKVVLMKQCIVSAGTDKQSRSMKQNKSCVYNISNTIFVYHDPGV